MKSVLLILLLLFAGRVFSRQAEDTLKLSLQQVVAMAKEKSIASKQASTVKETK